MKIFAMSAPDSRLEMIPDSSLVKDGKPFFIPGLADDDNWDYLLGVAFRVSRLGKGIQKEFADRYIDAATVCVMPRPRYADPSDILNHCFDGALIVGDWIPINSLPQDKTWLCKTSAGQRVEFCSLSRISGMIEHISLWMSMKMGDILVPECVNATGEFNEGTLFEASLNDVPCLSFRIK